MALPIFMGLHQPHIGTLRLSDGKRAELTHFAKLLLLDGGDFVKPSLLVQADGTVRPQIISNLHNLVPEGWPYFRKMQQENPNMEPAALIELFCAADKDACEELAFEKNLFCVRVTEALREALADNAPSVASEKNRAENFLKGLTVPTIVKNPLRSYPAEVFATCRVSVGGVQISYIDTRDRTPSR